MVLATAFVAICTGAVANFVFWRSQPKAPSEAESHFVIDGPITPEVAAAFTATGPFDRLVVTSGGGHGFAALSIAEKMVEWRTVLDIDGLCMSACVEFLVPAAEKVVARRKPVLAVHGNPILLEELYRRQIDKPVPECFEESRATKALYEVRGRSTEMALRQEQVLSLLSFETMDTSPCTLFRWKFRHSNWFPTSAQFAQFMGVQIEGELCADNERCSVKYIANNRGQNTCIVGEQVVQCE